MDLDRLLRAADESVAELVQLHCDLIRFPTVNTGVMPTGDETPCAEFLRDLLARDGITGEVIETAPGRGNLLAAMPGGPGRSLLLMSHLDVVPPGDESRWTHPPFAPEVVDGWVYGRGSNDCKGLVAPEVHVLRLLARHGVTPGGELKLACCADEEAGGRYGFAAIARDCPDRLRADLGLNEGGGTTVSGPDGRRALLVAPGEKGRLEVTVTVSGHSEHASVPWLADNPLDRLSEVLARLRDYRPEVRLTPVAEALIEHWWPGRELTAAQLDAWLDQHLADRQGEAARLRALTRMTAAPTVVRSGAKSNAIPDRAELRVDVRTLPDQDAGYVERELSRVLAGIPGVSVEVEVTAQASATPWREDWAQAVREALAAVGDGEVSLLPSWCTGFTDSRLVRPLGMPVLGLAPLPPESSLDRCGCHNIDEQFPVAALLYRVRFLLALISNWCG